MRIIALSKEYLEAFKAYCIKHKQVHDESYLYPEDLDEFEIGEKNPTYLMMEEEEIIGVVSLMLDDYFVAGNKTRIRIFHCEEHNLESYKSLLDTILPLNQSVENLEMFIPEELTQTKDLLDALGFKYYRTAYVMVRKNKEKIKAAFPVGYNLRQLVKGKDEEAYVSIRNTAFKNLKGSETPMTKEMIVKQSEEPWLLKEGMQLLWHEDKAVGIIRMLDDEDDDGKYSFVAPIALLPEYQGKGLGSILLQAGIEIGQKNGLDNCMLSVNAENENALKLYKKNGFEIDKAMSCYVKSLK